MEAEILKEIQKKLAVDTNFKYVDENWGQLDFYGKEIPVQWPAVLIDVINGQFSDNGKNIQKTPVNRQQGMFSVEITVANLKLTNSSYKAPIGQKNNAFAIWALVKEAHDLLHGYRPVAQSGALIRTGSMKVRRDDGMQEVRVTYTLGVHDC